MADAGHDQGSDHVSEDHEHDDMGDFGTRRHSPFSGGRPGGSGDIIGSIIESILSGPRRNGHPANPRGGSPFGRSRSLSELEEIDDDLFGGGPFGPGMSRDPIDMLGEIFGVEALDEIMGKGDVRVMAIGPDGPHMLHSGEAKFSDILRTKNGEDPLGLADMLKSLIENPPSRNQRKLSFLSMLDKGMPLTLRLYSYAGHAGAEIARFLRDPDGNTDFAFVQHLSGVLAKAKTDDKEAFANLQKRLKEYSVDLGGLIAKIQAFVDKPSVNTAKSVQMRLATAAPVALALLDDVSDDLKETRESFEEKLRRTAKI